MPYLISSFMPVRTGEEISNSLKAHIATFKPYKVNLTDEAKKGSRTMAEGREGYARMVSKIATNNIDSLARENDPKELEDRLAYDATLEDTRQLLLGLAEAISETQLANGIDIMKLVDTFVDNLQTSRSRNGSLDSSMGEVDDWNKRFAHKPDESKP